MQRNTARTVVTAAVIIVCSACSRSGADSSSRAEPGPSETPAAVSSLAAADTQTTRATIEESAHRTIDDLNRRAYADVFANLASTCKAGTAQELAGAWAQVGEQLGDPNFQLELRTFEIVSLTATQADVHADVVAITNHGTVPFGSDDDGLFKSFVNENGIWVVLDSLCSPSS